ncbi:hypothetical protein OC844_006983 [Tilletia horrida]|nr:hypothetical protein OC844_006983 [Tilletia horrida]
MMTRSTAAEDAFTELDIPSDQIASWEAEGYARVAAARETVRQTALATPTEDPVNSDGFLWPNLDRDALEQAAAQGISGPSHPPPASGRAARSRRLRPQLAKGREQALPVQAPASDHHDPFFERDRPKEAETSAPRVMHTYHRPRMRLPGQPPLSSSSPPPQRPVELDMVRAEREAARLIEEAEEAELKAEVDAMRQAAADAARTTREALARQVAQQREADRKARQARLEESARRARGQDEGRAREQEEETSRREREQPTTAGVGAADRVDSSFDPGPRYQLKRFRLGGPDPDP